MGRKRDKQEKAAERFERGVPQGKDSLNKGNEAAVVDVCDLPCDGAGEADTDLHAIKSKRGSVLDAKEVHEAVVNVNIGDGCACKHGVGVGAAQLHGEGTHVWARVVNGFANKAAEAVGAEGCVEIGEGLVQVDIGFPHNASDVCAI